jgi:hypothetical protein
MSAAQLSVTITTLAPLTAAYVRLAVLKIYLICGGVQTLFYFCARLFEIHKFINSACNAELSQ